MFGSYCAPLLLLLLLYLRISVYLPAFPHSGLMCVLILPCLRAASTIWMNEEATDLSKLDLLLSHNCCLLPYPSTASCSVVSHMSWTPFFLSIMRVSASQPRCIQQNTAHNIHDMVCYMPHYASTQLGSSHKTAKTWMRALSTSYLILYNTSTHRTASWTT
jgi:hypothetical protein